MSERGGKVTCTICTELEHVRPRTVGKWEYEDCSGAWGEADGDIFEDDDWPNVPLKSEGVREMLCLDCRCHHEFENRRRRLDYDEELSDGPPVLI